MLCMEEIGGDVHGSWRLDVTDYWGMEGVIKWRRIGMEWDEDGLEEITGGYWEITEGRSCVGSAVTSIGRGNELRGECNKLGYVEQV